MNPIQTGGDWGHLIVFEKNVGVKRVNMNYSGMRENYFISVCLFALLDVIALEI